VLIGINPILTGDALKARGDPRRPDATALADPFPTPV
jgi:hypothetical protein